MNNLENNFDQIRKGLLEFAVLTVIESKKVYAADILEILDKTEFKTQEGTLYPILSRLRREGVMDYEWVESPSGPPRKYYCLTQTGKQQLASFRNYWKSLSKTLNIKNKKHE